MKTLINLIQFILGVCLGFVLLAVGGVATARYLIEQFTSPPPRPIFAEEKPKPSSASTPISSNPTTPTPTPSSSPTPTPGEPKGYAARVVWPEGLILRDAPSADANVTGGVEYNVRVIVTEESPDGNWQKVWVAAGSEGWVKAGNLEKMNQ
jgi:hypothetical protein